MRSAKQQEAAEAKSKHVKGASDHSNPPRFKAKSDIRPCQLSAEEQAKSERLREIARSAKRPTIPEIADATLSDYEDALLHGVVEVTDTFGMRRELVPSILAEMFYSGRDGGYRYSPGKELIINSVSRMLRSMNPDLPMDEPYVHDERRGSAETPCAVIADEILTRNRIRSIRDKVVESIPFRRWVSLVSENPSYRFGRRFASALETVSRYDLRSYKPPKTKRRFVIDVGPTNSGKTYSGMRELMEAGSGAYLGPLRLLAMEAADAMNGEGCPCSLLTGEERCDVPGARHVASTVEMMARDAHYEVAVIDECQMIADPERGYAWAAAITSIDADVIHLCTAPEAYDLICSILDGLEEDYETVEHSRLVPLQMMSRNVKYPNGIKPGDALIVFSRKSVQRYAAELARHGIRASMVYGSLPYEVRKEEVRKFADGETDVVVATDAIGMGMNLPVRRVLFAETEKFDGHRMRALNDGEIKQIAGRAGRFGKYDIGYVGALSGGNRSLIANALDADYQSRSEIRVDMPSRMLRESSSPMSLLMRAWQMSPVESPYSKRDLSQQISLARRVEDLPNEFVYEAVEIPFKSGDRFVPLDDIWEESVRSAYTGKPFKMQLYPISSEDSLEHLEDAAKLADLSYGLAKRYGSPEDLEMIDAHRKLISEYMIEVLRTHGTATEQKCSWCGKPLSANVKHTMHDRCYREYRASKYARWDELYYGEQDFRQVV